MPLGRSRDITPEEEVAKASGSNSKSEIDHRKRLLLRASVASAVALPIIYGLGSLLVPRKEVQQRQLSPYLLALLRSKPIPRHLRILTWNLSIKGLVDNPLVINYKQLRHAFSRRICYTRMCKQ
jgi:DMSO/TMAO reductase YedYZ molybdopterin-dependent catalytic subunit